MSQRSMVEINHDFANFKDSEWVRQFEIYIGSGSPKDLPRGVTYFYRRHHSDDCPMGDPPHGWDNGASYKEPLWTPKRTATLDEMDLAAFLNMRDWLTSAVEAKGAKSVGGGVGLGQADIDIELEGCRYNISIRPLLRI